MKKIYLFLLFILPLTALAQQDTSGNISVIHYQEPDNTTPQQIVTLSTMEAMTSGVPTGNSAEVGVTAGQLAVSPSGGASYQIPIKLPPGIKNITPEIALTYDSHSNNGYAGYGWNISGVSSITRVDATEYHDGFIDPVDYDNNDRFALDGQRLMLKSGVYGQDGAVYETENFSNIKVTSVGTTAFGPSYFKVEYPDGTIAFYGSNSNSKSKNEWSITYWQNAQEVIMNYNYTADTANNTIRISTISYGSLAVQTPINVVEFIYITRNRAENAYVGGYVTQVTSILSEIRVKANNVGYRNYLLGYETTSLGYQRLISVTEKNGDNSLSLNPTLFSYDSTPDIITYLPNTNNLGLQNVSINNSTNITADFTGDGKMDFIMWPTTKDKYWLSTDISSSYGANTFLHTVAFEEIFPTNFLIPNSSTGNFRLYDVTGWVILSHNAGSPGSVSFDFRLGVSAFGISASQYSFSISNSSLGGNVARKYLSGDFNGDGLTDVMAIVKNSTSAYFVDLDRRLATHSNLAGLLAESLGDDDKMMVADFNGDGKSDILHFKNGKVYVYGINDSNQLIQLCSVTTDSAIVVNSTRVIMIGDYNGDGKVDFIVPQAAGSTTYNKFTSTGAGFIKTIQTYSSFTYNQSTTTTTYHYLTTDYNNDGKTDLLFITASGAEAAGEAAGTGSVSVRCLLNKNGSFSNQSGNYVTSSTGTQAGLDRLSVPVFFGPERFNPAMELAVFRNNKVHYFQSQKDFNKEKLLRTITLGNGVTEKITYSPVTYCSMGCYSYTPDNVYLDFPYYNITSNPLQMVVSMLEREGTGSSSKQTFRYKGGVTHMGGLGFMGFKATMRSNWYTDFGNQISNFTIYDTANRGIPTEDYSLLGDQSFFPTTPSNYITRSLYTNNVQVTTNKVFKVKVENSAAYNAIEGTSNAVINTYDTYNNLLTSSFTAKQGAITQRTGTVTFEYDDNATGTALYSYYIGRLKKKSTSATQNGTTLTSEDTYTYYDNTFLVKQQNIKGHNTVVLTQDFVYDNYGGNLLTKTLSTPLLAPRVISYQYDPSRRFIIKETDVEGLETAYAYNANTGLLASTTNPYGLTTTYVYDTWGKNINLIDYLGKNHTTTYSNLAEGSFQILKENDEGSSRIEIYDDLSRLVTEGNIMPDDTWSYVKTQYDHLNRPVSIGEPVSTITDSPAQTSTITYDVYGRVTQEAEYTGKTTNYTYSGLTTTVNDGQQTKVITKNALEDVVTVTDDGGTINYTHNPDSNVKQINYGGAITTLTYDGWGRKTKLEDVNTGTYLYEYNDYGELKKETTPKGAITYTLDDFGKLTEKSIVGDNTNSLAQYTYDPTTKLLTQILLNEGTPDFISYDYTYDEYKRLKSTLEWGYIAFYRENVYDEFGRVSKEFYRSQFAFGNNKTEKWIRNTYKNGYKWQMYDDASNTLLWENTSYNVRGQLTSGKFGNGFIETRAYDQYGYISQIKATRTVQNTTTQFSHNTVFDAERGNLTSRTTTNFFSTGNYVETFEYDNLDRLTEYTNVKGQQEVQEYDNKGRITENYLGQYNYDQYKPYRNTSIELNEDGKGYYNNRLGIYQEGFEDQSGWFIPPAVDEESLFVTYDTAKKKSGSYSLKINSILPTPDWISFPYSGWTTIENAQPTQYTYSGWVFSEGSAVSITLRMQTASGVTTTDVVQNTATGSWTYIEKTITIPANIKKVSFILSKASTGNVWFDDLRIIKTADNISQRKLIGEYNVFNSPSKLIETGVENVDFSYNIVSNRSAMYYGSTAEDKLQRPFMRFYSADGSMEVTHNNVTGKNEVLMFLGGDAYSSPVALKSELLTTAPQQYLYLHRDYLGSIVAISNQAGAIIEKRAFDAWGNIIKVTGESGQPLNGLLVMDRGYTGHEHIAGLNLINMNGRIYDPVVHRFLQVDSQVQDPYNMQNYNGYGYVLNNPLKYWDPSGETSEGGGGGWFDVIAAAVVSAGAYVGDRWDAWHMKEFFNDNVSNAFKDAGTWVGNQVRSVKNWVKGWFKKRSSEPSKVAVNPQYSGQSSSAWQESGFKSFSVNDITSPLDKKTFIDHYKKSFCQECTEGQLQSKAGLYFESQFAAYAKAITASKFNFRKGTKLYGPRNTVPDFIADFIREYDNGRAPTTVSGAVAYEVKAKEGTLYLSTNTNQIKGHIDNLSSKFRFMKSYGQPALTLVTTSDVSLSKSLIEYAISKGVKLMQVKSYYTMVNGQMVIIFAP